MAQNSVVEALYTPHVGCSRDCASHQESYCQTCSDTSAADDSVKSDAGICAGRHAGEGSWLMLGHACSLYNLQHGAGYYVATCKHMMIQRRKCGSVLVLLAS